MDFNRKWTLRQQLSRIPLKTQAPLQTRDLLPRGSGKAEIASFPREIDKRIKALQSALAASDTEFDPRSQCSQPSLANDAAGLMLADAGRAVLANQDTEKAGLEMALAKRDGEILCLREEVRRLQLTLQEAQESTANQIKQLEQRLANRSVDIEKLEAKLQSQQDYYRIKAELRFLRAVRQASAQACSSPPTHQSGVVDTQALFLPQTPSLDSPVPLMREIKQEAETPVGTHPFAQEGRPLLGSPGLPVSNGLPPSPLALPPSGPIKSEYDPISSPSCTPLTPDPSDSPEARGGGACGEGIAEPRDGWGVEEPEMETAEIARQVKEQLQRHNVGQRVFGQLVLGMAQGSVSEILARPKPWSKLTVKGREPFLRMQHFLTDEQNILALCAIQAKQRGSVSPYAPTSETGSDDAIKNILEKARREIQSQQKVDMRLPQSIEANEDDGGSGNGRSSEDTIKGILERARLEMQVRQETEVHRTGALGSLKFSHVQVKHKEAHNGMVDHLSHADFVKNIIRKVKVEISEAGADSGNCRLSGSNSVSSPLTSVSHSPTSSTSTVASIGQLPHTVVEEQCMKKLEENSQLVEVKMEAESPHFAGKGTGPELLMGHSGAQRFTVPPLMPDEDEMFRHSQVDTAELTWHVKEKLAEMGMCQQTFGEMVLGLPHRSVGDILSQPKPWSQLTQNGRKPFIRMLLWLLYQQEQVSHRLALNSYLLNDSSRIGGLLLPPPSPDPEEAQAAVPGDPAEQPRSRKENRQPSLAQDGLPHPGSLSLGLPTDPDIQQLVVCSPELDTLNITKRVKEVLTENNLGQRLFGDMVLGLTQGSVSDLLAHPKPWWKLSLKGREPFIRMQLWLKDPLNVQKLKDMKRVNQRASLKRHFAPLEFASAGDPAGSSSDGPCPYSRAQEPGPCDLAKRPRVVLSSLEREALMRAFALEPYPSQSTIERLASELALRTSTVSNWFYNHRSRMRQHIPRGRSPNPDYRERPQSDPQEISPSHVFDNNLSPMDVQVVTIKQESSDLEMGEEERDVPIKYASVGVQPSRMVKMEEEEDLKTVSHQQECFRTEMGTSCGTEQEQSEQSSKHTHLTPREGPRVRHLQTSEVSSPSSGFMPPASPIPPLADRHSPACTHPPGPGGLQSHSVCHDPSKSSNKMVNLNNVIHRLEQSASREETLEWEF